MAEAAETKTILELEKIQALFSTGHVSHSEDDCRDPHNERKPILTKFEQTVAPTLYQQQQRARRDGIRELVDNLRTEELLEYVKSLCLARKQYYLQRVELFTDGSNQDIHDYYSNILKVQCSNDLESVRTQNSNMARTQVEMYDKGMQILLGETQESIDNAYLYFQYHALDIENVYANVSDKKRLSYEFRKKCTERNATQEILTLLENSVSPVLKDFKNIYKLIVDRLPETADEDENVQIKLWLSWDKVNKDYDNTLEHCQTTLRKIIEMAYDSETLPQGFKEYTAKVYNGIMDKTKALLGQFRMLDKKDLGKTPESALAYLFEAKAYFQAVTESKAEAIKLTLEMQKTFLKVNKIEKQVTQLEALIENRKQEDSKKITEWLQKLPKEYVTLKKSLLEYENTLNEQSSIISANLKKLYESIEGENLDTIVQNIEEHSEFLNNFLTEKQMELEYLERLVEGHLAKLQAQQSAAAFQYAESSAQLVAEHQAMHQERLRKHQENKEKEKQLKLQKKAEDAKAAKEMLALKKAQKMELRAEALRAAQSAGTINLEDIKLSPTLANTLCELFRKPVPHYEIAYKDIVGLVEAVGGKVIAPGRGGSHRTIILNRVFGIIDVDADEAALDEECESIRTQGASSAGGMAKPHGKSHNKGMVSRVSVKQICATFARACITPITLKLEKKATMGNS